MLNLTQRLALGCTLLVALSLVLAVWVHRELVRLGAALGHPPHGLLTLWLLSGAAILVATATLILVLRPIQAVSRDIRRIASGDLAHRSDWGVGNQGRDSFGRIANEMNRLAVRLRELRETESGRRQMEFQLSDAVLQSIFEPIIVTDSKGHVLKLNQAAAELLSGGAASADSQAGTGAYDRMALIKLANTPGGDKIRDP